MSDEPRRRTRTPALAALAAALLIVLAILWRCPGTLGLGPAERASPRHAGTTRPCRLHIDRVGLHLEGDVVELEAAVARCKKAGEARITVTGDAKFGLLEKTKSALEAAGVTVFEQN